MRLQIDYLTRYTYDRPAAGIVQVLRVTPPSIDGQHVADWRVDTDADGWLNGFTDAHGNLCHSFYAAQPLPSLTIRVRGEVHTSDSAGVVGAHGGLPPPLYLRTTDLTAPDDSIRRLAAEASAADGAVARAHALMAAIHAAMTFDADATGPRTDAASAWAGGRGVCQDYAHVMIAAARAMGTPARYVSGHFVSDDRAVTTAGHAWAELWIDGLGWVGFDPTHGICPAERHVRVAVGLDYLDAAPFRGARRGGGSERMDVTVRGVRAAQRQSQSQFQSNGWQSQSQSQSGQSQ